jgi:nucleoside recognition membrane protein YjiH
MEVKKGHFFFGRIPNNKGGFMAEEQTNNECTVQEVRVSWGGYVALIFAIIFFSGFMASMTGQVVFFNGWEKALDFNTINGQFGVIKESVKSSFMGHGGFGARDGFLFALGLIPAVMLALGVVEVVDHLGGLRAAQKMLTPILKPILGIPGIAGLALVTSLQSTDAGAGMTRMLRESDCVTEKEKTIFAAFQFSAGGTIVNYLSSGAALFSIMSVPIIIPLILMFVLKIVGANIMRFYVNRFVKEV